METAHSFRSQRPERAGSRTSPHAPLHREGNSTARQNGTVGDQMEPMGEGRSKAMAHACACNRGAENPGASPASRSDRLHSTQHKHAPASAATPAHTALATLYFPTSRPSVSWVEPCQGKKLVTAPLLPISTSQALQGPSPCPTVSTFLPLPCGPISLTATSACSILLPTESEASWCSLEGGKEHFESFLLPFRMIPQGAGCFFLHSDCLLHNSSVSR